MSKVPEGYRLMASEDGYQASLVEERIARYYTACVDITDMSPGEVAKLMKQRQEAWNNPQLRKAA